MCLVDVVEMAVVPDRMGECISKGVYPAVSHVQAWVQGELLEISAPSEMLCPKIVQVKEKWLFSRRRTSDS